MIVILRSILNPKLLANYFKRAAESKDDLERRLLLSVIQSEVDRIFRERAKRAAADE